MTWDGESLPLEQLREARAALDALADEDAEFREAIYRILGLVCRDCDAPTPLAVLQHYDGRCEDCAGAQA